jgi:hypothetical protein
MLRDYAEGYELMLMVDTRCTCELDGEYSPECWGCYDSDKTEVLAELDEWLTRNGMDASIKISCKSMLWTHSSGYAVVSADPDAIFDALTLNGDYRLAFTWDRDDVLTVTRYSHDEPTGTAPFEFEPVAEDDGLPWTD